MIKTAIQDLLRKPVPREWFVKRLVCTSCRRRFDVSFLKDPTMPSLFNVTVACESCKHQNRVTIDESAAASGDWKIAFHPAA
jgi:RNase P subunit RPR2